MSSITVVESTLVETEHAPMWLASDDAYCVDSTQKSTSKETLERSVRVKLPDLFITFLAQKPNVNPHYQRVSKEAQDWLAHECKFNENQRKKLKGLDFSFFISIMNWEAPPDRLRTVCDWGNWVFPFDDMFDNGKYRDDPHTTRKQTENLLEALHSPETYDWSRPPNDAIKVHNDIWCRIRKVSPIGVQKRFAKTMTNYCEGVMEQVLRGPDGPEAPIPTIKAFLDSRRKAVGYQPLIPLMEYALALEVPDTVIEHPAIQELMMIATDFVILHNDMISYYKEQPEGVTNNIIAIYRRQGHSAQEAFDLTGELLRERHHGWYLACAKVPSWGERIDREVQRYIQGVQDGVKANINWSFVTYRYLGKVKDEVRRTSVMYVLPEEYPVVKPSKISYAAWVKESAIWIVAALSAFPLTGMHFLG